MNTNNMMTYKIQQINSSKGKYKSEYLYVILSLILLVAAGYTKNGSLSVLFIVFLLLPVNKPFLLLPVLFAATVSSRFFLVPFSVGLSYSRIVTVVFIVYSLQYFNNTNISINNRKFIGTWLLAFLFISFISTLFSTTSSFMPFFVLSLNLILFYLMTLYSLNEFEKKRLMNFLIISSIIIGITIIFMLSRGEITIFENKRLTILGVNSNRLAMGIAQVVSILLFVLFVLRLKVNIIFLILSLLLIIGLIYFLLQTGSRTATLAIILSLVTSIALFYTGIQRRNIFIGIILIGLIIYVIGESITGRVQLYGVYSRFDFKTILEGGGTHRIGNTLLIIKYVIPQNLITGVGIGADNVKQALGAHDFTVKNAAHNIIIDPLSQIGIFGFLTLWYMIIFVLKKSIHYFRNRHLLIGLPLSLLLVSLFNGIGETVYTIRFIWFAMGLCMMFLPNNKKGQLKID